MRKTFCAGLLCVLGCSFPAMALDAVTPHNIKQIRNAPVIMDVAEHPRMHVAFEHKKHNGIQCFTCHHRAVADGERLVPCSVSGCHADTDRKSRNAGSYFQAMHRADNDHSCVGCHAKQEQKDSRRLSDCAVCHDAGKLQTAKR